MVGMSVANVVLSIFKLQHKLRVSHILKLRIHLSEAIFLDYNLIHHLFAGSSVHICLLGVIAAHIYVSEEDKLA